MIKDSGFISVLHAHKETSKEGPCAFFTSPIFDNAQFLSQAVVSILEQGIEPGACRSQMSDVTLLNTMKASSF